MIPTDARKTCIECKKSFSFFNSKQKFCSTLCRNRCNVKKWTDTHKKTCPKCKKLIRPESETCAKCCHEIYIADLTLGEYNEKYKGKHPSWKNAEIRNAARRWNRHLRGSLCKNCGYDKHTEFCHIQPITSFPATATLKEINKESNLVMLCPNCHWEFDHGFLKLF